MDFTKIKDKLSLKSFKDDDGAFAPIITGVIALGVVGVIIIVMVMVYSNISGSIIGSSAAANATIAKTNANVYTGFDLGSIAPIVMAATLVIGIVMSLAAGLYMRR